MRIRWSEFESIFREFTEAAEERVSFFIDSDDGRILAGESRPDGPAIARHHLTGGGRTVGRLNICGSPSRETARLCWAACERELAQQIIVNDMAVTTARLWRQTNALLRMSASTSLALEPGAMLARVLGMIVHSTNFERGVALLRTPGEELYTLFGGDTPISVEPSSIPAFESIADDVLLASDAAEHGAFLAEGARLLGRKSALALVRIATDNDRYGYLAVPFRHSGQVASQVTSEDLKVLRAAAQIVSIAAENAHTLREEREATRLQVENEMLTAQARDMEEMLHVVSHDLRSPMTAMYGYMHMALDEAEELRAAVEDDAGGELAELGSRIATPLQAGIRSVEKLNRMVQRLLDFSRVARLDYHFEMLDMTQLARGVLDTLGFQIKERGIDATLGVLPDVIGDRVQVEAVFRNLVDNAIKYMGHAGKRAIEIGSRVDDAAVVFFVRDTGMGMTQDQATKAFLPFRRFRVDAAPGEGIGLSYVRKIVERHGGRIWCESAEGVGSTFSFTLTGQAKTNAATSAR